MVRVFSETPHGTQDNMDFPRPMRQSEAGGASRVPPSPGATARRTRGVLVEGATLGFSALVRHREGEMVHAKIHHLPSPSRGRSLHSDPWREGSRVGQKADSEEQQTTSGPQAERGKPGECTQPDIFDRQHGQLGTPLDSLGLRVDTRLTCPSTSRMVQWIPVQLEGFNEGNKAG